MENNGMVQTVKHYLFAYENYDIKI
jgi:ribosomal protein L30/L7E